MKIVGKVFHRNVKAFEFIIKEFNGTEVSMIHFLLKKLIYRILKKIFYFLRRATYEKSENFLLQFTQSLKVFRLINK